MLQSHLRKIYRRSIDLNPFSNLFKYNIDKKHFITYT